jgi:hypothetical protein
MGIAEIKTKDVSIIWINEFIRREDITFIYSHVF